MSSLFNDYNTSATKEVAQFVLKRLFDSVMKNMESDSSIQTVSKAIIDKNGNVFNVSELYRNDFYEIPVFDNNFKASKVLGEITFLDKNSSEKFEDYLPRMPDNVQKMYAQFQMETGCVSIGEYEKKSAAAVDEWIEIERLKANKNGNGCSYALLHQNFTVQFKSILLSIGTCSKSVARHIGTILMHDLKKYDGESKHKEMQQRNNMYRAHLKHHFLVDQLNDQFEYNANYYVTLTHYKHLLEENAAIYQIVTSPDYDRTYCEAAKYFHKLKFNNATEKYLNSPHHLRAILNEFTSEETSEIAFTAMSQEVEQLLTGTVHMWTLVRDNYNEMKSFLQSWTPSVPAADYQHKIGTNKGSRIQNEFESKVEYGETHFNAIMLHHRQYASHTCFLLKCD